MLALLRSVGVGARALAPKQPAAAATTRSLYIQVREGHDAERVASRLHGIMNEDGIMRTLALKRFHEKKWQRRKRKMEEQTIRHANRKIGSMIDFILQRKKAYVRGSRREKAPHAERLTIALFMWLRACAGASKAAREREREGDAAHTTHTAEDKTVRMNGSAARTS